MKPKKKVSYALSLCQEKGHAGNPIVSKRSFTEAQMQLLGTQTRRNRMREGCWSHYPAWWRSQGKEAKWQESPRSLCLGRSTELESTAASILSLVTITVFLLSSFSSRGWIALLLCHTMESVLYPDFYRIVTCWNKNAAKPSPLSVPSRPAPTPPVLPLSVCVQRYTRTCCESVMSPHPNFSLLALAFPQILLHAACTRAVQLGGGWMPERNRVSP